MEVAFVPPRHDAPRRARVLSVQDAGRDAFLVTFEGVDSIDIAELLVGCSCLVRRADLPESALAAEGGRRVLVPLVDALVVGLDEDARRIDVDLPDGLLDL